LECSELITNLLDLSGQVKFLDEIILLEKISNFITTTKIHPSLAAEAGEPYHLMQAECGQGDRFCIKESSCQINLQECVKFSKFE